MILDAGILYALADRGDPAHKRARDLLKLPEERIVPEPVVVEGDYLILSRLGLEAEVAFLEGLSTRAFSLECPTMGDRERATELVSRYHDARIGYVDAVVVAMAERLGERRIATVDHRHFGMIRPRHVEAFELLP